MFPLKPLNSTAVPHLLKNAKPRILSYWICPTLNSCVKVWVPSCTCTVQCASNYSLCYLSWLPMTVQMINTGLASLKTQQPQVTMLQALSLRRAVSLVAPICYRAAQNVQHTFNSFCNGFNLLRRSEGLEEWRRRSNSHMLVQTRRPTNLSR